LSHAFQRSSGTENNLRAQTQVVSTNVHSFAREQHVRRAVTALPFRTKYDSQEAGLVAWLGFEPGMGRINSTIDLSFGHAGWRVDFGLQVIVPTI